MMRAERPFYDKGRNENFRRESDGRANVLRDRKFSTLSWMIPERQSAWTDIVARRDADGARRLIVMYEREGDLDHAEWLRARMNEWGAPTPLPVSNAHAGWLRRRGHHVPPPPPSGYRVHAPVVPPSPSPRNSAPIVADAGGVLSAVSSAASAVTGAVSDVASALANGEFGGEFGGDFGVAPPPPHILPPSPHIAPPAPMVRPGAPVIRPGAPMVLGGGYRPAPPMVGSAFRPAPPMLGLNTGIRPPLNTGFATGYRPPPPMGFNTGNAFAPPPPPFRARSWNRPDWRTQGMQQDPGDYGSAPLPPQLSIDGSGIMSSAASELSQVGSSMLSSVSTPQTPNDNAPYTAPDDGSSDTPDDGSDDDGSSSMSGDFAGGGQHRKHKHHRRQQQQQQQQQQDDSGDDGDDMGFGTFGVDDFGLGTDIPSTYNPGKNYGSANPGKTDTLPVHLPSADPSMLSPGDEFGTMPQRGNVRAVGWHRRRKDVEFAGDTHRKAGFAHHGMRL